MFLTYISFDVTKREKTLMDEFWGEIFSSWKRGWLCEWTCSWKILYNKKSFDYEACKMIASPIDTKNFT